MTRQEVFPMVEVLAEEDGPLPPPADRGAAALASVDRAEFRRVMGSFASGVCVVTTATGQGTPRGFTCSAVCSVSADPPLLLVGVDNRSATLAAILERGRFAVNMLDRRARAVSDVFASRLPDKFDRVRWARGPATGMPVLDLVVAHAECVVDNAVVAGDHTLVVGRIVGVGGGDGGRPLAYWRGGYAELMR